MLACMCVCMYIKSQDIIYIYIYIKECIDEKAIRTLSLRSRRYLFKNLEWRPWMTLTTQHADKIALIETWSIELCTRDIALDRVDSTIYIYMRVAYPFNDTIHK
jgi:hypothetical protein